MSGGQVLAFQRKGGGRTGGSTAEVKVSEDSLAVLFANEFEDRARYDHHSGKWFVWDGQRWRQNETLVAIDWCRDLCRTYGTMDPTRAVSLGKSGTIQGVERLARVDRRLAVTSKVFDRDPWLIGTPSGTVDLRDGTSRDPRQEDFITKQVAVAPAQGEPELWLRFLSEATGGDAELVRFLQVACGYCLTGLTTEHTLFFAYGKGGNGKSVFINTVRGIMDEYAVVAPMETFVAAQGDRHPTDLAMLRGARMVTASETEEGRAWAESRIKQLTGGDPVSARFMRQDFFEFVPTFKLFIVGNHKPVLRNVDDAARRRFRLIPWLTKPTCPDSMLEENLKIEWPRILRWMIDGCIDWQADGLPSPKSVAQETERYFDDQDAMAQWMKDDCLVDEQSSLIDSKRRCLSSKLYASWVAWCARNGETSGSGKRFSQDLEKRGFDKKRGIAGVEFFGIAARHDASRSGSDGM